MQRLCVLLVTTLIFSCNSGNHGQSESENTEQLENNTIIPSDDPSGIGGITDMQWILSAVRDSAGQRFPVFQESDFQFTLFLSSEIVEIPDLNNMFESQVFGYNTCNGQSYGGAYRLNSDVIEIFGVAQDAGACGRSTEIQAAIFEQVLFSESLFTWSLSDNFLFLKTGDNFELEFGLQASTTTDGQEITTYFNRFLTERSWLISSYADSSGFITQIPFEAEWQMVFSSDAISNVAVMTLMFGPCVFAYKEYYTHDVDIRTIGPLRSHDVSCDAQAAVVLPMVEQMVLDIFMDSDSFFAVVGEDESMELQVSSGEMLLLSRL